jgi:hypothetical protein
MAASISKKHKSNRCRFYSGFQEKKSAIYNSRVITTVLQAKVKTTSTLNCSDIEF